MASRLSSLIVALEVNNAALRTGLDSAKSAFSSFGDSVKGIEKQMQALGVMKGFELGKDLVAGLFNAGAALTQFTLKGAELQDQMGKLASAAGVAVEPFSELAYAARLADVSNEDLGTAFKKLNVNLAEAGVGTAKQAALFQALGVNIRDASGNIKAGDVVFAELTQKFAGMEDGASKAALQVQLFGKSGAALNPLFAEGAAGLARAREEAALFGATVSGDAATASAQLVDNLERLKIAGEGVAKVLAAEFGPGINAIAEGALDAIKAVGGLRNAIELVGTATINTMDAVVPFSGTLLAWAAGFKEATAEQKAYAAQQKLWADAIKEDAAKAIAASKESADAKFANLQAIEKAEAAAEAARKKRDADELAALKKEIAEWTSAMTSLTKVAQDYETKVGDFGLSDMEKLTNSLDSGDLSRELAKVGDAAEGLRERIINSALALQELAASKLSLQIDFQIGQAHAATNREVTQRRDDFLNAGASVHSQRDRAKGGFESFDAAMAAFAKQSEHHARLIGSAELLRASGDEVAARKTLAFADEVQRSADQAGRAADAFQASSEAISAAIGSAVTNIASKLGAAGETINAGLQGFASGGPWGAVIAIIVDVFTKLEGFGLIVDSVGKFFDRALANINRAMGDFFENLVSCAEVIGEAIEWIADVTHSFEMIAGILKIVGYALLWAEGTIYGLMWAFQKMFGQDTTDSQKKMLEVAQRIADWDFNKVKKKAEEEGTKRSPGLDSLETKFGSLGDAVGRAADKFAELQTNMPSGYKGVRAAQFLADNGGAQSSWSNGDDPLARSGSSDHGALGVTAAQAAVDAAAAANAAMYSAATGENAAASAALRAALAALQHAIEQAAREAAEAEQNAQWSSGGGRSSSSSAATATVVTGGNFGIQSLATSEDSGTGGLTIMGDLIVHARDFDDLVRRITEEQENHGGQRRRNPHKSINR